MHPLIKEMEQTSLVNNYRRKLQWRKTKNFEHLTLLMMSLFRDAVKYAQKLKVFRRFSFIWLVNRLCITHCMAVGKNTAFPLMQSFYRITHVDVSYLLVISWQGYDCAVSESGEIEVQSTGSKIVTWPKLFFFQLATIMWTQQPVVSSGAYTPLENFAISINFST